MCATCPYNVAIARGGLGATDGRTQIELLGIYVRVGLLGSGARINDLDRAVRDSYARDVLTHRNSRDAGSGKVRRPRAVVGIILCDIRLDRAREIQAFRDLRADGVVLKIGRASCRERV